MASKSVARLRTLVLAFVYGTLTEPERAATVLGDWAFEGDAVLSGLRRADGEYPTLAPGGRVEGRLLRTDDVDRLDAYEGVDSGLYVRVSVPFQGRESSDGAGDGPSRDPDEVTVYVGDPERLGAPAEWPGEGRFEPRVRDFVAANEVVVRPLPPSSDRQR